MILGHRELSWGFELLGGAEGLGGGGVGGVSLLPLGSPDDGGDRGVMRRGWGGAAAKGTCCPRRVPLTWLWLV